MGYGRSDRDCGLAGAIPVLRLPVCIRRSPLVWRNEPDQDCAFAAICSGVP